MNTWSYGLKSSALEDQSVTYADFRLNFNYRKRRIAFFVCLGRRSLAPCDDAFFLPLQVT